MRPMSEPGNLHQLDEDLRESWLEDWIDEGLTALQDYLSKHLAFLSYLDDAATA
jgi:hypothetical protein